MIASIIGLKQALLAIRSSRMKMATHAGTAATAAATAATAATAPQSSGGGNAIGAAQPLKDLDWVMRKLEWMRNERIWPNGL
jgi:hypothetical protein